MSRKGEDLISRLQIELSTNKIEIYLTRTDIKCLVQHIRGLKRKLNSSYNLIDEMSDDLEDAYW